MVNLILGPVDHNDISRFLIGIIIARLDCTSTKVVSVQHTTSAHIRGWGTTVTAHSLLIDWDGLQTSGVN